jgi:anti-sigma regulatory factor (Ser/Thr protein kinase)
MTIPETWTAELELHKDERLRTAVQPVIVYASARAGLSEKVRQNLEEATAEACDEAFKLAGKKQSDPVVKVEVTGFPDRVEIKIEHPGETCLERDRKHVDRVECETRDGRSRTTLVKYAAASSSKHPH